MHTPLAESVLRSVRAYPDQAALHVAGTTYSYRQLHSCAYQLNRLVRKICPSSREEGLRIALAVDKSLEGYSAILATQLAEATWIPLSVNFPAQRNADIINQSESHILVIGHAFKDQAESILAQINSHVIVVFSGWSPDDRQGIRQPSFDFGVAPDLYVPVQDEQDVGSEDCLAYIMFTSGSTGKPKGVAVTQKNVVRYLGRLQSLYSPPVGSRFSQFFEFTFDLSVHDIFLAWSTTGCVYATSTVDKLMPAAYVRKHELTHWFSVPTMANQLQAMGQLSENSLPTLQHVLFCGEALLTRVAKSFSSAARNAIVDNLYGPTEATIAFSIHRFAPEQLEGEGVAAIGQPFDGLQWRVVNEHHTPCAIDEPGELWLTGDQLAHGYWRSSDLTDQAFVDADFDNRGMSRWYRTGDLVCRDAQGQVHFLGRIDQQVKIRGYRVELQEIERTVSNLPGVHAAITTATLDDSGSATEISLHVVASSTTEEQILAYCRDNLAEYMVPGRIQFLDSLPTNNNGKADRKQLQATLAIDCDPVPSS